MLARGKTVCRRKNRALLSTNVALLGVKKLRIVCGQHMYVLLQIVVRKFQSKFIGSNFWGIVRDALTDLNLPPIIPRNKKIKWRRYSRRLSIRASIVDTNDL